MSVGTWGYGVDLQKVQELIGSNNDQAFNELKCTIPIQRVDAEQGISIVDGLGALIRGKPLLSPIGRAAQLYALEHLCDQIGKRLAGQGHIAFWDQLDWETRMLSSNPPFRLPAADDFPYVTHLAAQQVSEEYDRIAALESEHENPETSDAREEYVGWLQQCKSKNLALVAFQY